MKKALLFILLAIGCIHANAQFHPTRCDEYLDYVYDKMTGVTYISTKQIVARDSESEILLTFMIFNDNILLKINTTPLTNCIPTSNKIYFLFTDQSRMEFFSVTTKNCDGLTLAVFGESSHNLNQMTVFKYNTIEAIRVNTESGFIQHDLTKIQGEKLMKSIQCLMLIPR